MEPKKKYWVSQVQKDLEELDIKLNKDQIKAMSQECFKNLCKKQVNKLAFKYLQSKKETHNKVKLIKYEKLQMEEYLKAEEIQFSVQERQFLFQCRMQDIDLRANRPWKYPDIFCLACNDESKEETGSHILECKIIIDRNDALSYIPLHRDLFSSDIQEQIYTSRMLRQSMHIREDLKKERLVPM